VRGRAAEGGRGSLTHHLELQFGQQPAQPTWFIQNLKL
jgi:hypothetical protein